MASHMETCGMSASSTTTGLPRGVRPRMGKMPAAVAYSGRSKSRIYEWGQQFPELFRKDGASTLIDFNVLDRILDSLPIKSV